MFIVGKSVGYGLVAGVFSLCAVCATAKPVSSEQDQSARADTSVNAHSLNSGNRIFLTGIPVPQALQSKTLSRDSVSEIAADYRAALLLRDVSKQLKLKDPELELSLVDISKDRLGFSHFRYQQQYQGVPVYGRELRVHITKEGKVGSVNGHIIPSHQMKKQKPAISRVDAVNAALQHMGLSMTSGHDITSGMDLVYLPLKDRVALVYRFSVFVTEQQDWQYFIDAETGAVLQRNHQRRDARVTVPSEGDDVHGMKREFNAMQENNILFMADIDKSEGGIWVYDARHRDASSDYGDVDAVTSYYVDGMGWSPVAVSAMYNAVTVYDYFKKVHQRDSYDGEGSALNSVINFRSNYDNAAWHYGNKKMYYGNGGSRFSETTACLDIAAHEITHGVIGSSAQFLYEGQSGALDESFADVFAAMIDRNWKLFEDCWQDNYGYARDMAQPWAVASPQPEHMSEYQNLYYSQDYGGVHTNSGIPNRAAYLIADGLSEESIGKSIGREKTEQIYYRALVTYLTPTSDFLSARQALEQSALDLYGQGDEVKAVRKAFDEVGIVEEVEGGSEPDQPDPQTPEPEQPDPQQPDPEQPGGGSGPEQPSEEEPGTEEPEPVDPGSESPQPEAPAEEEEEEEEDSENDDRGSSGGGSGKSKGGGGAFGLNDWWMLLLGAAGVQLGRRGGLLQRCNKSS